MLRFIIDAFVFKLFHFCTIDGNNKAQWRLQPELRLILLWLDRSERERREREREW